MDAVCRVLGGVNGFVLLMKTKFCKSDNHKMAVLSSQILQEVFLHSLELFFAVND